MTEILRLKWNNHSSIFIQTMDCLRSRELYCDATLVCGEKYYPIHRFVLSTCSEYFEEIFSRAPCKHPFVILKDIQNVHLEALLSYMYKGEVNVLQDTVPQLLSAAELLRIKGLAVPDNLDDDNFTAQETGAESSSDNDLLKDIRISSACSVTETKIDSKKHKHSTPSSQKEPSVPVASEDPQPSEFIGEDYAIEEHESNAKESSLSSNDPHFELQENEVEEIKKELDEGLNDNLELVHNAIDDAQMFVSIYNHPEVTKPQYDSSNNLSVPQCSSWNDNQVDADSISKEWLDASYYDSLSVDPLHFLSENTSILPSDVPDETPKATKMAMQPKNSIRPKGCKYECPECMFSSKDKSAFRLHIMRRHTGEKPFACTLCPYRCTTRDMLKIHTRRHTGEKPFTCPYCSLSMAVKTSLKRHILIKHIQPRNPKSPSDSTFPMKPPKAYKCDFCSYQSRMKSNLNLHCMRRHTGEKPIACTLCPYRTTTKPQLEKHMRRHTGEKPFECSFCSYKAAQKQNLLKHMSVHTK